MLNNYFIELNKAVSKKSTSAKTAGKKTASKKSAGKGAASFDSKLLIEKLDGIIPAGLKISEAKPIDSTGFSPEGADYIVYNEYCRDISTLFNGYIPFELIQGAFFAIPELKKNTLADALNRVVTVKKINRFSEEESEFSVPCFIVTGGADYSLPDLKNDVVNYYISKGVEPEAEFEIMMIFNQGILIKDWHSGNRSYVGLETGEDTLMWFYILISEYLLIEREEDFDLRRYIRSDKVYNEF
ncbi:MAG TPA: hypothetical protein PK358_12130 [Spirochaetota bacterium]|nr:hypothetical protein [Spirochaetota bacterium]HPJ35578.1 hypothetical protein [Spirochaetota bacterium]